MEIKPLTAGEFSRLDKLTSNSSSNELDWIKARIRSLSSEVKKLQEELENKGK